VKLFDKFLKILSFELNWPTNMVFWNGCSNFKPRYNKKYQWKWVINGEIFRLFTIAFRLKFEVQDIDIFFTKRSRKSSNFVILLTFCYLVKVPLSIQC